MLGGAWQLVEANIKTQVALRAVARRVFLLGKPKKTLTRHIYYYITVEQARNADADAELPKQAKNKWLT